jgi:hypothetical protein
MQYTRSDIYNITRRLYYLIRTHPNWIVFRKIRGACALYETEGNEVWITIDHRKDLIPGLVHEALHHWHPDWSETKVENNERMIVNRLTPRQIKNLIRVLAENI